MKLFVGIGNPGPQYANTRHNVGFRILEAFARTHAIEIDAPRFEGRFGRGEVFGHDVGLLEPQTFVNRSGTSLRAALDTFPGLDCTRDLIVVYDELDLPFGRIRLRPRGGPGGHRGVADVIETLQRRDFARLRFGVGRPPEGVAARDYVLQEFSSDERAELPERVATSVRALEAWLRDGVEAAMDAFNRETVDAT